MREISIKSCFSYNDLAILDSDDNIAREDCSMLLVYESDSDIYYVFTDVKWISKQEENYTYYEGGVFKEDKSIMFLFNDRFHFNHKPDGEEVIKAMI